MFGNVLSAYLTIAASAALVGATWLFISRARLWWFGARTWGELTGYTARMRARRGERLSYMPHLRFRHGAAIEFMSRTSINPARWPVGSRIPVAFLRDRPDTAEIALPFLFWRGPFGVLMLGLCLFGAALKASAS